MSLESFIGYEGGEGMSEAAFEQLRERMKAAAAQIAAIKKEEKKHKKKEVDLVKILSHFVKTSHKKDLTLLISRVLEQDIPAGFVLSIVILGNEEIQAMAGQYLMLGAGDSSESDLEAQHAQSDKSLTFFKDTDDTLPLKVKIEVDNWIKGMLSQAEERPHKLVKNAWKIEMIELPREYEFNDPEYEEKKEIKEIIIQLVAFVLRDFLEQNKIDEPYEKLYNFAAFITEGIIKKTGENLNNRQLLE